EHAPAQRFTADEATELGGPVEHPGGALAPGGLDQGEVGREDVVVLQRRRLVFHLVGAPGRRAGAGLRDGGHGAESTARLARHGMASGTRSIASPPRTLLPPERTFT